MNKKVYTKETEKFGTFRSNIYPTKKKKEYKFATIFFLVFAVFTLVTFISVSNMFDSPGMIFIGFIGAGFWVLFSYFCGIKPTKQIDIEYAAFLKEVEDLKAKEAKEEAYRKEHEDEIFYNKCSENHIHALDTASVARMKIIAKQMGITADEEELITKYKHGMEQAKLTIAENAAREKQARIPVLRKEEKERETFLNRYINLHGSDKRIKECEYNLSIEKAKLNALENGVDDIFSGADALYSLGAQKETDWAVHGGVATALGGIGAGIAVASDIQHRNAEVREHNAQLRETTNQLSQAMLMNNIDKIVKVKENVEYWEQQLKAAQMKLVEEKEQEELLEMLSPEITETKISDTGAITFTVSFERKTLTIYETVKASIDGTFKINIKDGENVIGNAYCTLPYKGSVWSSKITGICTSLPETPKSYTYEFAPYNLYAIEL